MKIHILSDLHIEFSPFYPPETEADLVVLAGDIHIKKNGIEWAMCAFPDKPVIYVLGNHEYYGEAIPRHIEKLCLLAENSNVHILEDSTIEFGGVAFCGATLWTDFRLFGDPRIAGFEATQKMTDYKRIRLSPEYRRLRSIDTANIHFRSRKRLTDQLKTNQNDKVIVVTHHAPSIKSIPLDFQSDLLAAAYASDLDELVAESKANLWIHGHIHTSLDYCIGETRVICNPRGYPDEMNAKFDPGFVIEI